LKTYSKRIVIAVPIALLAIAMSVCFAPLILKLLPNGILMEHTEAVKMRQRRTDIISQLRKGDQKKAR